MASLNDLTDKQFDDLVDYIFADDTAIEYDESVLIDQSVLTDEDRAVIESIDIEAIIELACRKSVTTDTNVSS